MQQWIFRTRTHLAALAVAMLAAPCNAAANEEEFTGREKLRTHSDEFRKDVIRVTDGVYVAVGYSASNVTLIQGDNGSIIVDTASNPVDAREVIAALGDRVIEPVRAIIYTHGHPDHTGGAAVFAGGHEPDIYSHRLLVEGGPEIARGMRDGGDQFGSTLPDSLFINAGIQLQYGRDTPHTREGFLRPTRTFSGDQLSLTIAGVRLELLHTPGETEENTAVWLPDKRVLLPGDNIYKAFPNLAPIRGTGLRSPETWVASLDKLIERGAEYLVPGHMRPVTGADKVRETLTAYRDGIQSIYDQTMEGIEQGLRSDELAQRVKLPPRLADHPYLQEYYGGVAWSVRAINAHYVGWFDGNATNMFPLPEKERAARIISMSGGVDRVLSRTREALAADEFQWAAELADYVLAVDRENVDARRIKARALTELGERQINATARNYYLSSAQYLLRALPPQ